MNKRFGSRFGSLSKKWKSLIISVVILFEVAAIAIVATNAWVETVSSVKITNAPNTTGTIDTYVYTDVTIGGSHDTIDLGKYFKQSGDMHLAPASSADGLTFFFPKANPTQNSDYNIYRKGDVSDKNTNYLSVTFRLKAVTNADFFFTNANDISVDDNIRVSVTAYTEGTTSGDLYDSEGKPKYTKVYAKHESTAAVVNSTSSPPGTAATDVKAFKDHDKGSGKINRLFAVGANETKIVTINVWLQKVSGDMDSVMSASQAIQNLGIISDLTPRHVTLIPTPTWDANSPTYYAWCYDASNGAHDKLFKLEIDAESEHYSFDYPGNYRKTTFVRAVPGCTVQTGEYDSWPFVLSTDNNHHDDNHYWNQTVDTTIPDDPINPTYIIQTMSDGTDSKSTGDWSDPVTVNIAYVTGQDNNYGSISATTYIGTSTSDHIMEQTNSSSQKHKTTLHGWNGKHIKLTATAKSNYAFVGWFDNAAGTGSALSTDFNISAIAGGEVTYYAKFKETRSFTLRKCLDGVQTNATTAAGVGTMTINGSTSNENDSSYSKTVDKDSNVTFSAAASTGYTFTGFYTAATGGTRVYSPLNSIGSNTTYYARFTTNYYLKASWNGWSETQDQLTGTGNELTFVQELDPGQYKFKIFGGGSHWSNAYEYKYNYNGSTYFGASGDDTLNSSNTTGDMQLNTGTTAKYTFHFNKSTKDFWITSNVDCHVVGDITGGWSTGDNNKMTRVGSTNEYTFTVKVNGIKEFKILTSSGTWYSNGNGYHDSNYGASGGDTFYTSSNNCTMNGSNKNYVFHFDISTQKFWITDS